MGGYGYGLFWSCFFLSYGVCTAPRPRARGGTRARREEGRASCTWRWWAPTPAEETEVVEGEGETREETARAVGWSRGCRR
ncbi:hypothetical protein B0H13DRAFT_2116721 [Mycena leptocephala]|nr:hypothetical protein B0H13DRAFT_2116721 [Mycena leptocephala]